VLGAAACLIAVATPPARAFEYKLSGHVNRLLMQVDDGTQSRLFHADNVNSQTRLRFTGTHDVGPGLRAGISWEVGYTSNPSSSIGMATRSVDATFNERHAEVFLGGPWGKASFGQGDGAANGGMEVDLSGTTVINYSGITDIGAGFAFRDGATLGPTIGATIGNLDFESRYDRIRYDMPAWGPLRAAFSFGTKGNNEVHEAAVSLASPLAGGKVAGTLGFSRERRGGNYAAARWLDLYAGAKQHRLDRPGADFDAINFVMAGMRLKF
jgi:predicted porin